MTLHNLSRYWITLMAMVIVSVSGLGIVALTIANTDVLADTGSGDLQYMKMIEQGQESEQNGHGMLLDTGSGDLQHMVISQSQESSQRSGR
jgi:hypothetical protein